MVPEMFGFQALPSLVAADSLVGRTMSWLGFLHKMSGLRTVASYLMCGVGYLCG